MSYSDFTIEQIKEDFDLNVIEDEPVFPHSFPAVVPELLTQLLARYVPLAITMSTEKARSELIIAPILAEFKLQFKESVSLFSGVDFTIDPGKGLNGRCDYILSKSKEQLMISAPVLMMVEAKNENITGGIPQCLAEMVAAQIYNQRKHSEIQAIFGVVTTGSLWRFLKLQGTTAHVDVVEYPIQQLAAIFGILTEIVNT